MVPKIRVPKFPLGQTFYLVEIWVANFLKTRRTMEGIKVKLPKLPEISFVKKQCPSLHAYQEFLKAKTLKCVGLRGLQRRSSGEPCPSLPPQEVQY